MTAPSPRLADVGVTGLATMGRNLARNLASRGHVVAVHNRSAHRTAQLVGDHGHEGSFVPADSLAELVAGLRRPRKVIVMVQAGDPTDETIRALVPLLDRGDRLAPQRERLHHPGTGRRGGQDLRYQGRLRRLSGARARRHRLAMTGTPPFVDGAGSPIRTGCRGVPLCIHAMRSQFPHPIAGRLLAAPTPLSCTGRRLLSGISY